MKKENNKEVSKIDILVDNDSLHASRYMLF